MGPRPEVATMPESTVTVPSSVTVDIELLKQAVGDMKTSQAKQHEETRAQITALSEQMKPIADLARDMALSRQAQDQQDAAILRCFNEVKSLDVELKEHIDHTRKTERTMWMWQGGLAVLIALLGVLLGVLAWAARDFMDQTRQAQVLQSQDIKAIGQQHNSDFRSIDHRLDEMESSPRTHL